MTPPFDDTDYRAARAIGDLRFTVEEQHERALLRRDEPVTSPRNDGVFSLNDLMRAFREQIAEMAIAQRFAMDDQVELTEFHRNKAIALEQELIDMEKSCQTG